EDIARQLRVHVAVHHEHRILHPADWTSDRGRLRIWERVQELGVRPDGPLGVLGGLRPFLASLRELVVRLTQHASHTRGIPPEIRRAGPRDIADVVRAKVPGLFAW